MNYPALIISALNFESEMEYGATKKPEKNNIFSNKLGNWQNDNFIGSFCKQL